MAKKRATKKPTRSPLMTKIWAVFKDSGMSMQELGKRMGYAETTARQAVSQFLKGDDPRFSMVQKFARATKTKLSEFDE
jgi:transcriptional regulator with XRE-family HTH domain